MLSDERIRQIAETHIGRLKDIGHKSGLVIRTDAELACESAIRAALAEAAPELLDVAEMVLALATIDTPVELIKAATAAIAKIEGGHHQ